MKTDLLPGCEAAKRAMEIAGCGNLNVLFIGPWELRPSIRFYAKELLGNLKTIKYNSPCPCGYYGDYIKVCDCSVNEVVTHQAKIKKHLDKFPIICEAERPSANKCVNRYSEPINVVQRRIAEGKKFLEKGVSFEREGDSGGDLLEQAIKKLALFPVHVRNIEITACAIAALAGREATRTEDIAEAICFQDIKKLK